MTLLLSAGLLCMGAALGAALAACHRLQQHLGYARAEVARLEGKSMRESRRVEGLEGALARYKQQLERTQQRAIDLDNALAKVCAREIRLDRFRSDDDPFRQVLVAKWRLDDVEVASAVSLPALAAALAKNLARVLLEGVKAR